MKELPNRKPIRIENYDYSTPGAYFITLCTANREKIFWNRVGADIIRPQKGTVFTVPFSMRILEDYSQYIPKSRHNPVDSESRGHKRISAK